MQNNWKKKKRHRMASFTETHVRYLDSMLLSPSTKNNPTLCLIFQKEAFALPQLWEQQAETLRRTISDPFCQINMYYFKGVLAAIHGFFFNSHAIIMVLYPGSYPPGFYHLFLISQILWLPDCRHKGEGKQVEGHICRSNRLLMVFLKLSHLSVTFLHK